MKVAVGHASLAGWITALLLVLPPALSQIISFVENNKAQLSSGEKWMAICGIASLVVTNIGRYVQAAKGAGA